MITKDRPHRWQFDYCGVVFWNENTAASEDDATRAVVYTGPPGMPYPQFEFKWPEQRFDVEKLLSALGKSFETGKWVAKKEIRGALGITERL